MRYLLTALTLGGLLAAVSFAGATELKGPNYRSRATPPERFYVLPFPRGHQARSVWTSTSCWSDCGRACAWGLIECVDVDAQGHCLKVTDRCDRYCQRACRPEGGPFLPAD